MFFLCWLIFSLIQVHTFAQSSEDSVSQEKQESVQKLDSGESVTKETTLSSDELIPQTRFYHLVELLGLLEQHTLALRIQFVENNLDKAEKQFSQLYLKLKNLKQNILALDLSNPFVEDKLKKYQEELTSLDAEIELIRSNFTPSSKSKTTPEPILDSIDIETQPPVQAEPQTATKNIPENLKKEKASVAIHQLNKDKNITKFKLNETIYYESGHTNISEDNIPTLASISQQIKEAHPIKVLVIGYTDKTPIQQGSSLFTRTPTNWDLSTRRASKVVQSLISQYQIPSNLFIVAGRSYYTNENPNLSKKQSRRVEIWIYKNDPLVNQS